MECIYLLIYLLFIFCVVVCILGVLFQMCCALQKEKINKLLILHVRNYTRKRLNYFRIKSSLNRTKIISIKHVNYPWIYYNITESFKTDPLEDVIFVREKFGTKVLNPPVDWARLQILQRDIDYGSLPDLTPTSCIESLGFVTVKRLEEKMKTTIKDETLKKDKVKKVKKHKKDDIPENNTETIKKTEKMLLEISDNNDIKKKKKKRKLISDPENVTDDADVEVCEKKRIVENVHTDSAGNFLKDESVKDKKKQKKIKNKSMQTKPNVEIIIIEDVEDDNVQLDVEKTSKNANKVKKEIKKKIIDKKDKRKKTKLLAEEGISVTETAKTKTPKKNKSKMEENGIKIEFSERDQIENGKEKKKKKDKNKAEKNKEIKHEINKDYKVSGGNEDSEETKSSQVKKKKHKKTKSENEMDTAVDKGVNKTDQDSLNVTEHFKLKKKKNSKRDKEPLLVECEVEAASKSKQKKCSKKVESKVDIDNDAGTKKKKKKIKEEQVDHEESSHMEVVFLSEKFGNTDEVNVNKERRKVLQMEIDQASQPKNPAKPLGLGQWSTAEFGSSEQQQKFLRLMGGFKKGFQPASVSGGGGNMALGRDAQQQLQQGLLGEFERAHSRRMDSSNKGTGLGFIAPSTKKFSIDANATRSIRFDD